MGARFSKAISKLVFCIRHSAGLTTFCRLIWFTKKWSRIKKADNSYPRYREAIPYFFNRSISGQALFLRTETGDLDIFYEIFWQRIYAYEAIDFHRLNVIVDLGAHIGLASLFFLARSPLAKIYSIEPEQDNFSLLHKNLQQAVSEGRAVTLPLAVSDKDHLVGIKKGLYDYNNKISGDTDTGQPVEGITFQTLSERYDLKQIDLLKIDIEGAERYLFSGSLQWLARVKRIIIETHSPEDNAIFYEAVTKHGFTVQRINKGYIPDRLFFAWRKDI